MKKKLPDDLTSYDLLKTLAVVTMIIDHIGFYFFPDDMMWRAVGRMSAPIWIFLIGYARGRDFSPRLWIGGFTLLAANVVAGMALLPLNILFTILLVRGVIDRVMDYMTSEKARMIAGVAVIIAGALPTYAFWEYGTAALMLAGMGWMARQFQAKKVSEGTFQGFTVTTLLLYAVLAIAFMGLNMAQTQLMTVGVIGVFALLYSFKPATYPRAKEKIPGFVIFILKICGRRTLEIYVLHLLIFKFAALYLGMENFGLMDWRWLDL